MTFFPNKVSILCSSNTAPKRAFSRNSLGIYILYFREIHLIFISNIWCVLRPHDANLLVENSNSGSTSLWITSITNSFKYSFWNRITDWLATVGEWRHPYTYVEFPSCQSVLNKKTQLWYQLKTNSHHKNEPLLVYIPTKNWLTATAICFFFRHTTLKSQNCISFRSMLLVWSYLLHISHK